MKSQKDFRTNQSTATQETIRKAVKLDPIRKSGKEKHEIYKGLNHEDEDEDYMSLKKRESILDYMGDDEEDEFLDDEPEDEDYDEEEDYYDEDEEEDDK